MATEANSEHIPNPSFLWPEGTEPHAFHWARFYALLSISVVIVTVGLYYNSTAVVIAAMLLAPLTEPLLGTARALVLGLARQQLIHLAFVLLASVYVFALAYSILWVFDVPKGRAVPYQVMLRTDPGLEDLLVALAAGTAAAYLRFHRETLSALPGVAIAVALVAPLAAAGILVYYGEIKLSLEAVLLYITNLAAIILSACAVYVVMGLRPFRRGMAATTGVALGWFITLSLVGLLAMQLATATINRFTEAREEERVAAAVEKWRGQQRIRVLDLNITGDRVDLELVFEIPIPKRRGSGNLFSEAVLQSRAQELATAISKSLGRDIDLELRGLYELSETFRGKKKEPQKKKAR
ncbi:MAG: DUF389 domain-containing protein [Deltaproteobacteria bacterium]|nr:DUF389 domain-containing protein [Deltaproteobacteria bacterium]